MFKSTMFKSDSTMFKRLYFASVFQLGKQIKESLVIPGSL